MNLCITDPSTEPLLFVKCCNGLHTVASSSFAHVQHCLARIGTLGESLNKQANNHITCIVLHFPQTHEHPPAARGYEL